jgi:hypothetical protein
MAKRAREQAVKEKRDRKREKKAEAAMQPAEPTAAEPGADDIVVPEDVEPDPQPE